MIITGCGALFMLIANDTRLFIEKHSAPIAICSTENAAYWTGYYLNKCNIDFVCYIDKSVGDNTFCNGKPVYSPEKFASTIGGGREFSSDYSEQESGIVFWRSRCVGRKAQREVPVLDPDLQNLGEDAGL